MIFLSIGIASFTAGLVLFIFTLLVAFREEEPPVKEKQKDESRY